MVNEPSDPYSQGSMCPHAVCTLHKDTTKAVSGSWNKPRLYSPSLMPWQGLLPHKSGIFSSFVDSQWIFFNCHKSPYKQAALLFFCLPFPLGQWNKWMLVSYYALIFLLKKRSKKMTTQQNGKVEQRYSGDGDDVIKMEAFMVLGARL